MLKLKLNVSSKEAFIMGAISAAGQVVISEIYRTYVDIDPFAGVRNKIKVKKRKKQFEKLIAQTDLKRELA